jgi:hypothetical protein
MKGKFDMENISAIDEQAVNKLVSGIMESRDIASLKTNAEALMRLYESTESMHGFMIRNRFYSAVKERDEAYQRRTQGLKYNAVIIPPELVPTAMIPAYVKMDGNHYDFADNMSRLISRCDEFTSPVHPAISETEIQAVLGAAQWAFGMIDTIAPDYPLRIYRFDHSHIAKNSECGVTNSDSRQSVVFVYHPRESEIYNRIFIFAHELGHAFHFALTGDVDILPDGFDNLNKVIGVKLETPAAKAECFADAAAIAILGSPDSRLKSHLPTQFCKDLSQVFVRYFMPLRSAGRS